MTKLVTTTTAPRMSDALRNREFRALWFAEAQSVLGDHLTTVALSIVVYGRTGSALWAAVVYALTFLPALAGGLGLSQIADRRPRKTVLVVSFVMQAVFVGTMAIPGTPLAVLVTLVVLARLAGAPANAAQNALTREVFADDELYLRSQDALTFLVAAALVQFSVRQRPVPGDPGDGWFSAVRWVWGQRRLRVLLALSWLVGLAVIPEGLAAPLAHQIGASEQAVGWLLAADPVGFILGTFVLSRFVSAQNRKRIMGVLATLAAAVLIGFAATPTLPFALLLLMLAGAAGAYIITVGATFITWVPNELRGGAGGVYRTGLRVAQGLGVALGGVIADLVGSATFTIALAGMAGVVLTIPVAVSWARILKTQ